MQANNSINPSIDNSNKQEFSSLYKVAIITQNSQINLNNEDILTCYFIEDLFSISMTGKIQLIDHYGLLEFAPVIGSESIKITYGEKEEKNKQFLIQKISRVASMVSTDGVAKPIIEIFFADSTFMLSNYRQYSKSWKDTKISDIIKDISTNMLGISEFNNWEESNESLEYFYMANWTPMQAISWLLKRGSGNKSKNAGYVFYSSSDGESENGALNYITLDTLLDNKELLKLEKDDDGTYSFDAPNMFDFNKIISSKISGIDKNGFRGIMGGNRFGFDYTKNRIIKKEFKYTDSLDKHTTLGEYSLFNDISEQNVRNKLLGESSDEIIENMYYSEWIKRYVNQNTISIIVRGHEGRTPGNIIEIIWPSLDKKNEMYNKLKSGGYMIKSITHSFSRNTPSYQQKLVLIKNGYQEHPTGIPVKSTKTNLLNSVKRFIG